ncbi:hypothetical protein ACFLU8_04690 [Chloroflexota bacterium]
MPVFQVEFDSTQSPRLAVAGFDVGFDVEVYVAVGDKPPHLSWFCV